ncbi:MAG: hypothetical protein E6J89_19555 [Deltaproteobacteria bacterium]|nr:MAG: hypothetical protein E6J89_19555 [Deltaproteobacteria bacterium]
MSKILIRDDLRNFDQDWNVKQTLDFRLGPEFLIDQVDCRRGGDANNQAYQRPNQSNCPLNRFGRRQWVICGIYNYKLGSLLFALQAYGKFGLGQLALELIILFIEIRVLAQYRRNLLLTLRLVLNPLTVPLNFGRNRLLLPF